jgi:hypothetical protein
MSLYKIIEKQNEKPLHNLYNYIHTHTIMDKKITILTDDIKNTFVSFLPISYITQNENLNELISSNFDKKLNDIFNEELIKLNIIKNIKYHNDKIIITFNKYYIKYLYVISNSIYSIYFDIGINNHYINNTNRVLYSILKNNKFKKENEKTIFRNYENNTFYFYKIKSYMN